MRLTGTVGVALHEVVFTLQLLLHSSSALTSRSFHAVSRQARKLSVAVTGFHPSGRRFAAVAWKWASHLSHPLHVWGAASSGRSESPGWYRGRMSAVRQGASVFMVMDTGLWGAHKAPWWTVGIVRAGPNSRDAT